MSELTCREEQVCKLIIEGLRNKEIGSVLNIKEKSVKSIIWIINKKWQTRNRTEIAMEYLKRTEL